MRRKLSHNDTIPIREAVPLFFSSLKRICQVNRKYVLFSFLYSVCGIIPVLLNAFAVSVFNQRIIKGLGEYAHYWQAYYPLLVTFAIMVIYGIWGSVSVYFDEKYRNKITSYLLRGSSSKAAAIDLASFDDPEFFNLIQKGWSEDGAMLVDNANVTLEMIMDVTGFIGYTSLLSYIDWKVTLVFIALRVCLYPVNNRIYRLGYRLNNRLAEERRREQCFRNFFSTKGNVAEGRVFDLFDYAQDNYQASHRKIYKATFLHKIKTNAVDLLAYALRSLPLAVGYIYFSICVYKGTVSLANMAMYVALYDGFINQVYNAINGLSSIRGYAERSRYAREFQTIKPGIHTEEDPLKDKVPDLPEGHTVEFRDVSFKYPGTEKNVLEKVSFVVRGNETVSIIGANGAGKTTLICLLMRLYDPTEGIILLDGKDLRDYSAESLYGMFGVLCQDYCNYAVSARESITLSTEAARESITLSAEDRLAYALRASTADKFVGALKNGIDTPLSKDFDPDGAELSVGQKQRIALARAYYKKAQVLILDEPSASIDPQAEAEIYEAVHRQRGKKGIWLITHRLSSCVQSDQILLFQDGKLIGNGTHSQLFNGNAEYKRMFLLQAQKYGVTS